jgi:hypothetical protein
MLKTYQHWWIMIIYESLTAEKGTRPKNSQYEFSPSWYSSVTEEQLASHIWLRTEADWDWEQLRLSGGRVMLLFNVRINSLSQYYVFYVAEIMLNLSRLSFSVTETNQCCRHQLLK